MNITEKTHHNPPISTPLVIAGFVLGVIPGLIMLLINFLANSNASMEHLQEKNVTDTYDSPIAEKVERVVGRNQTIDSKIQTPTAKNGPTSIKQTQTLKERANTVKKNIEDQIQILDNEGVMEADKLNKIKDWAIETANWVTANDRNNTLENKVGEPLKTLFQKILDREEYLELISENNALYECNKQLKEIKDTNIDPKLFEKALEKLEKDVTRFQTLANIKDSKACIEIYKDAVRSLLDEMDRITANNNSKNKAALQAKIKKIRAKANTVATETNPKPPTTRFIELQRIAANSSAIKGGNDASGIKLYSLGFVNPK